MNWIKDFLRRARAAAMRARMRLLKPLPLPEGEVVIVAPHPDDEVLGCGGLIARLCAAGRPPHVVILTRGEGSHRGCCSVADNDLAAARHALTLRAAELLGLPLSHLHCLCLPDGGVEGAFGADSAAFGRVGGAFGADGGSEAAEGGAFGADVAAFGRVGGAFGADGGIGREVERLRELLSNLSAAQPPQSAAKPPLSAAKPPQSAPQAPQTAAQPPQSAPQAPQSAPQAPLSVFVPHWGEGWSDHVAGARLVRGMVAPGTAVWEYCVWMWYYNVRGLDWRRGRVLRMTPAEFARKRAAAEAYVAPKAPCGRPWSGVLPAAFLSATIRPRELYFHR